MLSSGVKNGQKINHFLEKKIGSAKMVKYRADMIDTANQVHVKRNSMLFKLLKSADLIKS